MSLTGRASRHVVKISRHASVPTRGLHATLPRAKISHFLMPAMSPTMTEGGIATWKVKEGGNFKTGEVLLEIETDKATIDVEAQDDGILGKIIAADGTKNIEVGKVIALLAEEGDDISNLEVLKEEESNPPTASSSSSTPKQDSESQPEPPTSSPSKADTSQPIHIDTTHAIFPSVLRLLHENSISPEKVKGTGRRGMLTKGDVLAFMGRAQGPTGTYKETSGSPIPKKVTKEAKVKDLDAPTVRRLIVEGMSDISQKSSVPPSAPQATFDTILADYLPLHIPQPVSIDASATRVAQKPRGYLDGLF